jgi:hypothetical protein
MKSNTGRGLARFGVSAALLAMSQWPLPAAAHHVRGITVSVTSANSTTRAVTVNVVESTSGGTFHTAAHIQWGDAMSSNKPWTASSSMGGLNFYKVLGVSHTYPNLTDRIIKVTSDCCNTFSFSPDTDTAAVQLGCSDAPKGGCNATAATASLQIKNDPDDSKDKLKFKLLNSNTPSFDDPTSTTEYYLCIYAPGLVLQAVVPPATNWSASGSGFKYTDPTGAAGGATKIKLKAGAGNAKIQVKGAGANLDDPLPLTQPVLVQVQNSGGQCWEHGFTAPEIENTPAAFKDKEP